MRRIDTDLPGVFIIEPDVHGDSRGFFMETWNRSRYAEVGLAIDFVQDNLSLSGQGVLRGLHFQNPVAQDKLVYVLQGEVFDVAVDIRVGSPTFAKWAGAHLSAKNNHQFFVPKGFAHGFCVLSQQALFAYKCTDFYHPQTEIGILWNDPDIGIQWPLDKPLLSAKDNAASLLKNVPVASLPVYDAASGKN